MTITDERKHRVCASKAAANEAARELSLGPVEDKVEVDDDNNNSEDKSGLCHGRVVTRDDVADSHKDESTKANVDRWPVVCEEDVSEKDQNTGKGAVQAKDEGIDEMRGVDEADKQRKL